LFFQDPDKIKVLKCLQSVHYTLLTQSYKLGDFHPLINSFTEIMAFLEKVLKGEIQAEKEIDMYILQVLAPQFIIMAETSQEDDKTKKTIPYQHLVQEILPGDVYEEMIKRDDDTTGELLTLPQLASYLNSKYEGTPTPVSGRCPFEKTFLADYFHKVNEGFQQKPAAIKSTKKLDQEKKHDSNPRKRKSDDLDANQDHSKSQKKESAPPQEEDEDEDDKEDQDEDMDV